MVLPAHNFEDNTTYTIRADCEASKDLIFNAVMEQAEAFQKTAIVGYTDLNVSFTFNPVEGRYK